MPLFRLVALCLLSCAAPVAAQDAGPSGRVHVRVTSDSTPVSGALVKSGGVEATTSAAGDATIALPAGSADITVSGDGFVTGKIRVTVTAGADVSIDVHLEAPTVSEEVTVAATRANVRVQDEPLRVEVLGRDEVEEKLLMTPGDIAMLLNETAGLRVQVTSPSLGAASLRVQGLRGRYTQLLADGLPLYGGQSGSIGLLQIPPMDLGRVEIIKGVASSLFGSSALGGVVNLISRQPAAKREAEALVNQTTQGGTDGMLWLSGPVRPHWGYTLLAAADHQHRHDVDEDGWADIPRFGRVQVRPRVFWNDGAGRSLFVTAGIMGEDRSGGTMPDGTVPDGSAFTESLRTRRQDAGMVSHLLVGGNVLGIRASFMSQGHDHQFGPDQEHDVHRTGFGEASLTGAKGRHTWVLGGAFQGDTYRNRDVPAFDYQYWAPAAFAQDDVAIAPSVRVSVSARLDHHSEFGTFLSPRASALWRFGGGWTARGSAGTGYFAPTPLTEETEAVGLHRLTFADLSAAERARSFSVDLGRTFGPVEINVTAFGSRVTGTLDVRPDPQDAQRYVLLPLPGPTRTHGSEALATLRHGEFSIVATYTYVHATEPDPAVSQRLEVAVTPRHTAGIVAMWEREGRARAGVESYFTGRQRLDENPYRERSEPYWYFGAMAERRLGAFRVFVNTENLADRRQTRFDPLVRPTQRYDGRWTVDAWGPLEGFVLSAGFRVAF